MKPFISKEPQDKTILTGKTVHFDCMVGGDPQPHILWRKDDGDIPVGRASVRDEGKSLVIRNIEPMDEGTYFCEANNSVGYISAKAHLTVHGK